MPQALADQVVLWRHRLQVGKRSLREQFQLRPSSSCYLQQHSWLMDQLLQDIWQNVGMFSTFTLIATGGYGRRELYPHSDVDFLVLYPTQEHDLQRVETFVRTCWDVGIAAGNSVYTVDDCIRTARTDITITTNLIESRFLVGDCVQFCELQQRLLQGISAQTFFRRKMEEQQNRHAKFSNSTYSLEPNLKENPGGLRDLHAILWLSRVCKKGNNWNELSHNNILNIKELNQVKRHERVLQGLRIHLHHLAQRREDRLLFDYQKELASLLGLHSSVGKLASEKLMQRYYQSAGAIRLMNEIMLQTLQEELFPDLSAPTVLGKSFYRTGSRIAVRHPDAFLKRPRLIFEGLLWLQQQNAEGFTAATLRALWQARLMVSRQFRMDKVNQRHFLDILRHRTRVTTVLRILNRYGLLGRYIPAFGRIMGQMQHDLFHIYTVDEHTINVIHYLRRFIVEKPQNGFTLCHHLMSEFDRPELLFLAALFHDIGKGRGGDHSTLGAKLSLSFCCEQHLSHADSDLIAWLVAQHLSMSRTIQKTDLSNPETIQSFAQHVQNKRRLTALYLLTVADIRATSPAIWNHWKATALEYLFTATLRVLAGEAPTLPQIISERQHAAEQKLRRYTIMRHHYDRLWHQLGDAYFVRYDSPQIIWHTRAILKHGHKTAPLVKAQLSDDQGSIQIFLYTPNREALFARICAFFERLNYSIVEAKIYTTSHGYALHHFTMLNQPDITSDYGSLLHFIEHDLAEKIHLNKEIDNPMHGVPDRQLKYFPIQTRVQIKSEGTRHHQLEVVTGDRPGLLSHIAQILLAQNVSLLGAKINTLGNRAEDTFTIVGKRGKPLSANAARRLQAVLIKALP